MVDLSRSDCGLPKLVFDNLYIYFSTLAVFGFDYGKTQIIWFSRVFLGSTSSLHLITLIFQIMTNCALL